MSRTLLSVAAVFTLLLQAVPASAHPGHGTGQGSPRQERSWTNSSGLVVARGSFAAINQNRVQIRKADDALVSVPLGDLCQVDLQWLSSRAAEIERLNREAANRPATRLIAFQTTEQRNQSFNSASPKESPAIARAFDPFVKTSAIKTRWDDRCFYVESNSMPNHPMMIGITAWQQQVPLPQPYAGSNAWQIPLYPKLADKPISAKNALFRGAIALAANGVPIFNALNNRGVDSYLAGELDEFGGHCGRADDYHYHQAPVHLESVVGKGNPIGYALDGFALYGYTDTEGNEPKDLDEFNGRMEKDGYRYYSTKKYPYINGGMRGVVTVQGDQVDPQPRAAPVRPAEGPLNGAKITDFKFDAANQKGFLAYDVRGTKYTINYTVTNSGQFVFVFADDKGNEGTESYLRRERPEGRGQSAPPRPQQTPQQPGRDEPPRREPPAPRAQGKDLGNGQGNSTSALMPASTPGFALKSSSFKTGGAIPVEFTGDGAGISPPLFWSGAPTGTKFFAINLWHQPGPGGPPKSYWLIYNIPASVTSLPKNAKGIGVAGYNDKHHTGYDPMKSKGPGVKEYHVTIYALSSEAKFKSERVSRSELLDGIKTITLGQTTLSYTYER